MASIANWIIIPVIITSITFIRLGIIFITPNIILLFHKKKDNETLRVRGKTNSDAYEISLGEKCLTELVWKLISHLDLFVPSPDVFEE